MFDAKAKYIDKLTELEKCIDVMTDNSVHLSHSEFIEIMKLQLQVQKELYRMAGEHNDM